MAAEQDVLKLCEEFLQVNPNAQGWASDDTDNWEPDCDVMSEEFIAWLKTEHDLDARLVRVTPTDDMAGLMVGDHWFAVLGDVAVDWTARQFYNVPTPPVDWRTIPFPLIFPWPGQYPLGHLVSYQVRSTT